ncbi:MAG: hypothetical protein K2X66_08140 [Cyanobacteria bacterium]|nr:hypothetical protein [Cyanobacteriota bacterium]
MLQNLHPPLRQKTLPLPFSPAMSHSQGTLGFSGRWVSDGISKALPAKSFGVSQAASQTEVSGKKPLASMASNKADMAGGRGGLLGRLYRATLLGLEYRGRILVSNLTNPASSIMVDHYLNFFKSAPYQSEAYVHAMLQASPFFTGDYEFEVNTESGRLEKLAESDEACIFLMNHDHQPQDPAMLSFFNMMLYQEYLKNGKGATCPRPKIILNQDILHTISDKNTRALYRKMGSVPVDARVPGEEKDTFGQILKDIGRSLMFWKAKAPETNAPAKRGGRNSQVMVNVLKGFNKDQCHVFLFPEGRMAALTDEAIITAFKKLTPEEQLIQYPLKDRPSNMAFEDQMKVFALNQRFQVGISSIIQMAAKRKKRVKVVPLGFDFKAAPPLTSEQKQALKAFENATAQQAKDQVEKSKAVSDPLPVSPENPPTPPVLPKSVGSIYIGEPLYFNQTPEGKISVTLGNINADDATPQYTDVFDSVIQNPESVWTFKETEGRLKAAIGGVLAENLRICKVKSSKMLTESLASQDATVTNILETKRTP